MSFNNKEINRQLRQLLTDFANEHESICKQSRAAYIEKLGPGEPVPAESAAPITESGRAMVESLGLSKQQQMREILAPVKAALRASLAAPPSAEAVNACQMLRLRGKGDVSEKEIEALLSKYQDNPATYRTIRSIASSHGIYDLRDDPTETQLANVERVEKDLDRAFNGYTAAREGVSRGFGAFVGLDIDAAFPGE